MVDHAEYDYTDKMAIFTGSTKVPIMATGQRRRECHRQRPSLGRGGRIKLDKTNGNRVEDIDDTTVPFTPRGISKDKQTQDLRAFQPAVNSMANQTTKLSSMLSTPRSESQQRASYERP